jgi:hypothetical protein
VGSLGSVERIEIRLLFAGLFQALGKRTLAIRSPVIKFASERRTKDQDLADRIRKQKGDYSSAKKGDYSSAKKGNYNSKAPEEHQSNATEGRREGDAGATEGRREGDYDRKPLNRRPLDGNPIDKKPMNDSPPTPNGGVHRSQASDAGVVDSSPPVPIEHGYSFEGQFFTSEQASRFLADNADRAQEIIRKIKPGTRQENHVQLSNP